MAEIIKETVYENIIVKETEEPFSLAIKIKEMFSSFGVIEEKENRMFTTEEGTLLILRFDVVKQLDKISKIVFSVDIEAGIRRIEMRITGFLQSTFREEEKTFNDFYKLELYPDVLEDAKKIISEEAKQIENFISSFDTSTQTK